MIFQYTCHKGHRTVYERAWTGLNDIDDRIDDDQAPVWCTTCDRDRWSHQIFYFERDIEHFGKWWLDNYDVVNFDGPRPHFATLEEAIADAVAEYARKNPNQEEEE